MDIESLVIAEKQNEAIAQEVTNRQHDETKRTSLNVIGEKEVEEAMNTLLEYKQEKSSLEQRLVENEKMWQMAQWELSGDTTNRVKPKSAWLVNTILNKHADAMDNFPEANVLPRAADDEETAKILSKVIPVILEQTEFEGEYSDEQYYKEKNGTGVYSCIWDNDMENGLGNISIKSVGLANIYYKGGRKDFQKSPNVFFVSMMDNDVIKQNWPDAKLNFDNSTLISVDIYNSDEKIDTTKQSVVVDWYYKRKKRVVDEMGIPKTITVLHYCKFTNGTVLYATENDPDLTDRGWYDHGLYPFVLDVLFPMENSCTGFGYIDMIKDDQMFVDKMQQAFMENTAWNATPRAAVRSDVGLNEEEFLDLSKPLIHFEGNLGEDAFRQIQPNPLPPIYQSIFLEKIQEMKDTSGNTASSQGQASNVTSASGIASLQEASGKLSRDSNKASYRQFKKLIYMVIELIRQFYTEPRTFRITNELGQREYVEFDNSKLMPQQSLIGTRLPMVDIEVKPQKQSAYSKESQNQTAINLYNLGFFAPNNADASLACLDMMDFDGIEKVRENVSKNQTLFDMVMQLQMQMAQLVGADPNMIQAPAQTAPRKGQIQESKGSLSSQAAAATRGSASPV